MSDGVLSQEEIDALLRAGASEAPPEPVTEPVPEPIAKASSGEALTVEQVDAIGEVANIVMGSAATALSSLVGQKIDITTPKVLVTTPEKIRAEHPETNLLVNVEYVKGIEGTNLLIIKETDAQIIVDCMMGGNGSEPPKELTDIHLSAIGEAMNQMMGSASTSMSTVLNRRIEISPPTTEVVNLATDPFKSGFEEADQEVVCIDFKINVEGLIDSEMMQLIPLGFARQMAQDLLEGVSDNVNVAATAAEQAAAAVAESIIPEEVPLSSFGNFGGVEQNMMPKKENVTVQPAQFSSLQQGMGSKTPSNIDLIMDVPLQVTVELGRSRKTIKEILALGPGSVVELDKLAGEPVDLIVNGKLLAKGEVVVIDENFGIRVTDIVSPMERVTNLQ